MSLYNPHPDTVMTISTLYAGMNNPPILKTFIDTMYIEGYLLYLSEDITKNSISMLTHLTRNDLMLVANVYNKHVMAKKFSKSYIDKEKLHLHTDEFLQRVYVDGKRRSAANPVPEHINALNSIRYTVDKARHDIQYIEKSELWNVLDRMGIGYTDYSAILKRINTKYVQ